MVSIRKMILPGMLPSFFKVRYYRWFKKAKIGKNVKIGMFSYVDSGKINIGDRCKIGVMCFISTVKTFTLKENVMIGPQTSIRTGWFYADDDTQIYDNVRIGGILTPKSSLIIGKRVGIFPYSYINPSCEIILDDDVGIGGRCHLFTHGVWPSVLDGYPMKYAPIKINKNVWLAWRVTVLPGVNIGPNSIIQSDTLVSKSIPEGSFVKGNPMIIKSLKLSSPVEKEDYRDFTLLIIKEMVHLYNFIDEVIKHTKTREGLDVLSNKKDEKVLLLIDEDQLVTKNKLEEFRKLPCIVIETREVFFRNSWSDEVIEFFKQYGIRFRSR